MSENARKDATKPPKQGIGTKTTGDKEEGGTVASTADDSFSPMRILVTLMTYIARSGGGEVPVEQKAEFVTVLRKHVDRGDMTNSTMQAMMRDSFEQVGKVEFATYLKKATPHLTRGQRLSVIANLYDMMMVDGELLEGEELKVDLCRRAFDLDPVVTKQIRRVLLLKNDTSMFLNPGHPGNDPKFLF